MSESERDIEVVVFGATSVTGRRVPAYLAQRATAAATIAATVAAVLATGSGTAAASPESATDTAKGTPWPGAPRWSAALEPPQSCPDCARRMVVQVTPIGLDGAVQPAR